MKRIALLVAAAALGGSIPAPALAQVAGVTAAVNPQASRTPPGQAMRTVVLGDNIVQNEQIETSGDGLVQVLLADGTTFTVGPNSSISIDRFVFDPNAGTAEVTATMTRGVFRFIGGRTSKTQDGVRLNTPVGTVGIRGGMVDINLTPSQAGLLAHFDLLFGNEVTLEGQAGSQRIYSAGYSLWVDALGRFNTGRTPPQWRTQIFENLAGGSGNGGSPNRPTNEQVAASNVSGSNSNLPSVARVVPTPRPLQPNVVQPAAPRTYSGQTFNGFAAGMSEETQGNSSVYRNTKTRQVRTEFDGDNAPFYGRIKAGYGSVNETFGADGEPSAYVDDDNFGALSFETYEQGEGEESNYPVSNDGFMVSGRSNNGLAPSIDGFDLCDDCAFLQWGWWGSTAQIYFYEGEEPEQQLVAGAWVTGAVTNPTELSQLAESVTTQANFNGGAAGMISDGYTALAATGNMSMSWNFASQVGSLAISEFGNDEIGRHDFNYVLEQTPGFSSFRGFRDVEDLGPEEVYYDVSGAFVNDGARIAAGVLGNFEAYDYLPSEEIIRATGVFGGVRGPDLISE